MTDTLVPELNHVSAGSGPPLVFLHPIAMRLEFWGEVAAKLSTKYRTIRVDLRGHGRNAPAVEPYSTQDLASDVIALARRLGLRPAVFVGCSLGGMVAQGVAIDAPELVAGLVLSNTTHRTSKVGAAIMRDRARRCLEDMRGAVASDIERWFTPAFRAGAPDKAEEVRRWALANDPRTVANGWLAIASLDNEAAARLVEAPVLAMTGSLDPASPPEATRAMQGAFANASYLELPGAGHFAPIEQPRAYAEAVDSFVREAFKSDIERKPQGAS
jgi:pimeloyl-ACP methyl ester carboxylesterase